MATTPRRLNIHHRAVSDLHCRWASAALSYKQEALNHYTQECCNWSACLLGTRFRRRQSVWWTSNACSIFYAKCWVQFLANAHSSQKALNLRGHWCSFHPRQWSAPLWRCPAAWRKKVFTAHFHFIDAAFSSGTSHTGRWAVPALLTRPATGDDCTELVNGSAADRRKKNIHWLMQRWSITCPCLTPSQPNDITHFCPSSLTNFKYLLSNTQSDKSTFSRVDGLNKHRQQNNWSQSALCSATKRLLHSVWKPLCTLVIPNVVEKWFLDCYPRNKSCFAQSTPVWARPIPRPTCQRRECLADGNAKQARHRKSEELLWYSQTKRPRQAEGFSLLPQAWQHYKSWNIFFKRTDRTEIKHFYTGTQTRKLDLHLVCLVLCDTWEGGIPFRRQIGAYCVRRQCWLHLSDLHNV